MILRGIKGLIESKKALMCILIIAASMTLAILGKLDANFAAIMSVVATIYCHSVTKTEQFLNTQQGPL
jgi:ArsR family metal-binding transcriptional regulator